MTIGVSVRGLFFYVSFSVNLVYRYVSLPVFSCVFPSSGFHSMLLLYLFYSLPPNSHSSSVISVFTCDSSYCCSAS